MARHTAKANFLPAKTRDDCILSSFLRTLAFVLCDFIAVDVSWCGWVVVPPNMPHTMLNYVMTIQIAESKCRWNFFSVDDCDSGMIGVYRAIYGLLGTLFNPMFYWWLMYIN